MNHTSTRKNKKLKSLLAILTGVVLLLGSTYAWRDLSQHKTNPWGDLRDENTRNVTLNDEFTPPETLIANQLKKVSVSNLEDSGGLACVRLSVKEFMQLRISDTGAYYTETKDGKEVPTLFATFANDVVVGGTRYKKGEYMTAAYARGEDLVPAKPRFPEYGSRTVPVGMDPILKVEQTVEYATTTIKELRNGIYGKPMKIPGKTLQIWGTAPFAQPTHIARMFDEEGKAIANGECNYNPYRWDQKGAEPQVELKGTGTAPTNNNIRDYVTLNGPGGSAVTLQTLQAWKTAGGTLQDKWIYDPSDGYVYWANHLKPGQTTENLLESVNYHKTPGTHTGAAKGNNNDANNPDFLDVKVDYFIHIDMDACDETEKEILAVFSGVPNATWAMLQQMVNASAYSADKLAFLKKLANVA